MNYEYTCRSCGRADHDTKHCPSPASRLCVGFLCEHGAVPKIVRPGYQCDFGGDVAVYEGDRVTVTTQYLDGVVPKASIMRGCRAVHVESGRQCALAAGHRTMFNHSPGYGPDGEPLGLHWQVEPPGRYHGQGE